MRRLASLVAVLGSIVGLPVVPARAGTEATPLPPDTILDVRGHGWGHGRGMGQWGAKGMADDGNSYVEILDHYYRANGSGASAEGAIVQHGDRGNPLLRVLVEASQDVIVTSATPFEIRPHGATELAWTSTDAKPFWRITYAGGEYRYARAATWNPDTWEQVAVDARYAEFARGESLLELVRNGGSVRRYRGSITARWSLSDGMRAINNVRVEDYLRGVVPRESPASWPAAALRAQSVAARTYAHRYRDASRAGGNTFDICATTSCQVYEGNGSRTSPGGAFTSHEVDSTDAAIEATAGKVLLHEGDPILAEFSSSTGGYTAPGTVPYQVAVPDPGDRVSPHHVWTASIRVTEIEARWPSIGRLVRIEVTDRNGYGDWGGRVRRLELVGTQSTVGVSGDAFRGAFAWPSGGEIRSSWFTIGIVRAERAGVPTNVTIPSGSTKQLTFRYRNAGSDPWFVGGELQLETDAPSPFRHEDWLSSGVLARIARNATRPSANLVDPGEVAEFVVPLDAREVAVGEHTIPIRLQPAAGRVIDRVSLEVDVVESWRERAPNLLTSGSFEKALTGWTLDGSGRIGAGRDVTPGLVLAGAGRRVLEQRISFEGGTGRRFLVGGWTQRRGVELTGRIELTYARGAPDVVPLEAWTGSGWRYREQGFRSSRTRPLTGVTLRLVADVANGGRADLDAFRLVEDPIGTPSFEAGDLGTWTIEPAGLDPPVRRIDWAATDGRASLRVPGRAGTTTVEQRFELAAEPWERLTLRFDERVFGATDGPGSWTVRLSLEETDGTETTGLLELADVQHGWRSQSLELRPDAAVTHGRIRITATDQTGRADLDAFRLLRSRHRDPSFEGDGAWGLAGLGARDGLSATAARDGARGVRLEGHEAASTSQRFALRGTRERRLRVSLFDAVTGVLGRDDLVAVAVTFLHRDGSRNTVRVPLGVRAHPWTYREAIVAPTEAYDEVRLAVLSRGHAGVVFVDQLQLTDL